MIVCRCMYVGGENECTLPSPSVYTLSSPNVYGSKHGIITIINEKKNFALPAGKKPSSMVTCVCKYHKNPRLMVYTSGVGKLKELEDILPEDELRAEGS